MSSTPTNSLMITSQFNQFYWIKNKYHHYCYLLVALMSFTRHFHSLLKYLTVHLCNSIILHNAMAWCLPLYTGWLRLLYMACLRWDCGWSRLAITTAGNTRPLNCIKASALCLWWGWLSASSGGWSPLLLLRWQVIPVSPASRRHWVTSRYTHCSFQLSSAGIWFPPLMAKR